MLVIMPPDRKHVCTRESSLLHINCISCQLLYIFMWSKVQTSLYFFRFFFKINFSFPRKSYCREWVKIEKSVGNRDEKIAHQGNVTTNPANNEDSLGHSRQCLGIFHSLTLHWTRATQCVFLINGNGHHK